MMKRIFLALTCLLVPLLAGCGDMIREKPKRTDPQPPPPTDPEEAKKVLREAGKDVVYGKTLGEIAAGIVVPPYGLYKLGQAGASALGYDLDATRALPPEDREKVNEAGKAIISAPGRAAAAAAGEEYREKGKVIKDD